VFGFDVFLGVRLHGHAVLAVQMFVDGHELVLHRLVALHAGVELERESGAVEIILVLVRLHAVG